MTWSLVMSRFIKCGQIGGNIKIDFLNTVVMCIHKSKRVLKGMFSILKKSGCKNWIYQVLEFSRNSLVYVTKSLSVQKTRSLGCWETEMLRN